MSSSHALAQRLPDIPRWVEARALLLRGDCEIFGLREAPDPSFVVRDPVTELVVVIGTPAVKAIRAAVEPNVSGGTVIAPLDRRALLAEALPEWHGTRAILHVRGSTTALPAAVAGQVRFLDPEVLERLSLPEPLRRELEIGAEHSRVAATYVEGQPVSFCYAGAITESLWDIAIDTLPGYRRHGYASLGVAYMIQHMAAQGKQPVWGAVEENPASWRLAQKLGFVPVDELALFEPCSS
jgi:GNAT superfamily N-acetyltransferase